MSGDPRERSALNRRVKGWLFEEPAGGRRSWLPVAWGVLLVLAAIAGLAGLIYPAETPGTWLQFVLAGLAFVAMGAAELLPADRRRATAALRAGSMAGLLLFGLLLLLR